MKAYTKKIKTFLEDRITTLEELKILNPVFRGGLFVRDEGGRIIIHLGYDIDLAFSYRDRKRVRTVLKKLKYRLLERYPVLNGYYELYRSSRDENVEVLYTLERIPSRYNRYFRMEQASKEWVYVNDKIFVANQNNMIQFLKLVREGQINPVCFHEVLRKSTYRHYILNKLCIRRRKMGTAIIYASLTIVFITNFVKNPLWGLEVITHVISDPRRLRLSY